MSPKVEKIISWVPLVTILLLLLVVWVFLLRGPSGPEGIELLQKACPAEKVEKIEKENFTVIYRNRGCERVSLQEVRAAADWGAEWDELRGQINLPPLLGQTAIDVRPDGRSAAFWRLGRAGAVLLAKPETQGQYKLFTGLNELALRESFPRAPRRNITFLAKVLAVKISPNEGILLVLPEGVREFADGLSPDWSQTFIRCQGRCLQTLSR